MADRPESQGPEWVLYEDLPEDGEIVGFKKAGDSDEAFGTCQSEDGDIGTLSQNQGGAVCGTPEGAEESFYVLDLSAQADDEDEDYEGETGGLALKLQKKVMDHQSEQSVEAGMLPDFDWSEEEQVELSDAIRDALEETDAW